MTGNQEKKPFSLGNFNIKSPKSFTTTTGTTTSSTTGAGATSTFKLNLPKTTTTPATTNNAEQPINIPPELKNKNIKEILETMESQLEQQVRQFQTQARQIARWDRSIYDIIDLMIFLEKEIKTVETKQKELYASASTLLQEQKNFLQTLRDKISSKKTDDFLSSSDQRAILYNTASDLGKEFHKMESQLKEIVEKTENAESQDSISDIDKVVQISNCHLDSLQWISNLCSSVEEKLNTLGNQLH